MVGDKDCDVEMGKALGLKTVLVLTGYGEETKRQLEAEMAAEGEPRLQRAPDYAAKDLLDGARWIVDHS